MEGLLYENYKNLIVLPDQLRYHREKDEVTYPQHQVHNATCSWQLLQPNMTIGPRVTGILKSLTALR